MELSYSYVSSTLTQTAGGFARREIFANSKATRDMTKAAIAGNFEPFRIAIFQAHPRSFYYVLRGFGIMWVLMLIRPAETMRSLSQFPTSSISDISRAANSRHELMNVCV